MAHVLAGTHERISNAFHREVRAGVKLAVTTRSIAFLLIAVWIVHRAGWGLAAHYLWIIGAFILSGWAQYLVTVGQSQWSRIAVGGLVLFDMILIVAAVMIPHPSAPADWPPAMQLRLGNFDFLFVFAALAALAYSPVFTLWTGVAAAIAWSLGVLWILNQDGVFTVLDFDRFQDLDSAQIVGLLQDPDYVSAVIWGQQVLLIMLVSSILAVVAFRARRLARKEALAATERSNLARYFSPNMATELSMNDPDVSGVRQQEAAIMFCDIVGFTPMAEAMEPVDVISFLRIYHETVADVIFEESGTIDKYMGDGLMVTFGTPRPLHDDAARAVRCCASLIDRMNAWSDERVASGQSAVRMSVGVHFGTVVIGDVGDDRCLEFAVVGDVVNTASRLESMTRQLDVQAVISEELAERALQSDSTVAPVLERYRPLGGVEIRGRSERLSVRTLEGRRRPSQAAG
ncbi:MAG: adenylate/guanylate cyclase domain-containing protein [Geminicoccaceae bacterium]